MLQHLYIQNYAIIEEVSLDFSDKMTIITGETGAGKSILIGALSLIIGERADTSVLYDKDIKCIVEGHYHVGDYQVKDFFEEHDLDYAEVTLLRREINNKGRSRAFINDTPVTLKVLRQLGQQLVDIHAQHESLELGEVDFQMHVIDSFAQHQSLLTQYQSQYQDYQKKCKELETLKEEHRQIQRDLDYYQFQLEEIQEVELEVGEKEELEQQHETLEHTEQIKENLMQTAQALDQGDHTITQQLGKLQQKLLEVKSYNEELENLYERLHATQIELQDIAREVVEVKESTDFSPQELEEIEDRLDTIYQLEQKHQVEGTEALLQVQNQLEQKIDSFESETEEIEKLEQETQAEKRKLLHKAEQLSEQRQEQIPSFEKEVNALLEEMGMPYTEVKVEHELLENDTLNVFGKDRIRFVFSPDKGEHFLPIQKAASGGELSRLMLSIKSLIAENITLPTLIFDEIDTGISGEIAFKVGDVLKRLAQAHQVICITHLPQIAGKGQRHYFIYKEMEDNRTKTKVRLLESEERVQAIAEMLSGEEPSEVALENAKQLLED